MNDEKAPEAGQVPRVPQGAEPTEDVEGLPPAAEPALSSPTEPLPPSFGGKAGEVEIVNTDPKVGKLPVGVVPSRNYAQAVELGHVLAASGLFTDARDPAKAAVKVMVGMDLGISPTAALRGIHTFEDKGRVVFLIEGKILGAIIRSTPGYDYRFVERDETRCTISFLRNGEAMFPDVTYTLDDAQKAGLMGKDNWKAHPREMLTWRCLAEGQRIHFPELTGGQPIYAAEEFGEDGDSLKEALQPAGPVALDNPEAEAKREKAAEVFGQLQAINFERVPPGRFASMIAGAEHSLARLDQVIASLEDLRDTEIVIADLSKELAEKLSAEEFKALVAKAERRGSNRERIDVLREALGFVDAAEAPAPADG